MSRSGQSQAPNEVHIREMLVPIEASNGYVELPFKKESIDIRDLTAYIKSELTTVRQHVPESTLHILSTCVHQQLDTQSQMFYLLRLVFNETYLGRLSHERKTLNLANLTLEDVVNTYIGRGATRVVTAESNASRRFIQIIARKNSVPKCARSYSITSARLNQRSVKSSCWTFSRVTMNSSWNTFHRIYRRICAFHRRSGWL